VGLKKAVRGTHATRGPVVGLHCFQRCCMLC